MIIFVRIMIVLAVFGTSSLGVGKPFARGIVDLPGAISADKSIGALGDHPWENPNVAGLRIRIGWNSIEPADGVFNWTQIDECLALAFISGKFIGLGVGSGLDAPPWLMGGVTFGDAVTTVGSTTFTSDSANFTSADVGRVIVSLNFPVGTTIASVTSSTVATTSKAATKGSLAKKPATFSILRRNSGGAAFRVLTAPDEGVMVVPWDPVAKAKWKELIVALAARYDNNPQFQYLVMSGFQKTGECYLAQSAEDVAFFDASAEAAGYSATETLPAGLVAWEATVKEVVAQYMTSLKNTPLVITGARPYGGDFRDAGQTAMQDIFGWGPAAYPGRFGVMNSQLHVTSSSGYYLNKAIVDNAGIAQTGIQFLCAGSSANPDNLPRLCDAPPWGEAELLSIHDAVESSCAVGASFGLNFIEVYEEDVNNPDLQELLAAQNKALGGPLPPQPPTNLHIVPQDG